MLDPVELFRSSQLSLTIIRFFNAPRERLYRAWTEEDQLRRWWGPRWHPAAQVEADARPGGVLRCGLRSATTGEMLWHRGVFRELVAPERISFTFAWEEKGERGLETLVNITFAEHSGRTRMVLQQTPFQSEFERDGHQGGWSSAFERLHDFIIPDDAAQT